MTLEHIVARCTACNTPYVPTEREIEDAVESGCLMSPCCYAPATVEEVTAK